MKKGNFPHDMPVQNFGGVGDVQKKTGGKPSGSTFLMLLYQTRHFMGCR